ncbi:MAG: hypothetical protein HY912_16605 [Desulfomonile tiedjei]|uniref:Uncharacterized protein n=1 Tax=Desulfomonile tiedjei TaxID=2358 RepID=A0A9D6V6Y6_9BACT|nr:hypothetical protein [Desulfomonile tiedjei]
MSGRDFCASRRMRFAMVLAILAATICPDVSIGAGTPVPGYLGWTSLDSGGSTWYFYNDYGRFSFNNSTSKWYAYDQFSKQWQTLSGTGASGSYLFDGALHDLHNGWNYLYSTPLQTGNWARSDNGAARLGYDYSSGRWYQFDPYGGSWRTLTGSARSGYFLGNGALNDLGNGWKYVYGYVNDSGNWARSDTGTARFGYTYNSGQWWGYRTGWTKLGNRGNSSSFMGDGAWHTVSSTWAFSYNSPTDTGTWSSQSDGSDRFQYSFGVGQWYSTSSYDSGTWNAVGAAGVSSVFVGDGAWHGLNNGWSYVYNSTGDYALYRYGANQRFQYNYRDGQWFNTGAYDAGSWYAMSGPDMSSSFIADGNPHNLNNGWTYTYLAGEGRWANSSGDRFRYAYADGQWWDYDFSLNWNPLGAAGLASQFLGDGAATPHELGNGWTYRYGETGSDEYYLSSLKRFTYDVSTGVWTDYARIGDPQQLGADRLSGAFIGDGTPHDLANGFEYMFDRAYGYWLADAAIKFAYLYEAGQWFDYDNCCNRFALGTAGLSAEFIGNGSFHDLGNGWYYGYDGTSGYWAGLTIYSYLYSTGDWFHYDKFGDPYALGTDLSAAFIGDGGLHYLGNGFSYRFDGAYGYWLGSGANKFSYLYEDGQWFDYDRNGNSFRLGVADLSGAFIGDGGYYNLGNGFSYGYDGLVSHWLEAGVTERFQYDYANAAWSHLDKFANVYQLGNNGLPAAFIGDGSGHDLGNGYAYAYDGSQGVWLQGGINKFSYVYSSGQWSDWDVYRNSFLLGAGDRTGQFMGDGIFHDLGNTWSYKYDGSTGYWQLDGFGQKFSYLYGAGQWFDWDKFGNQFALGSNGLTALFIGNGSGHDLGNGWTYVFMPWTGVWQRNDSRFTYQYMDGRWYHESPAGYGGALSGLDLSAAFIADGAWHATGLGQWSYRHEGSMGYWKSGTKLFSYEYQGGQWFDHDYYGSVVPISSTGINPTFIGDGSRHQLTTNWDYQYDQDRYGNWYRTSSGPLRYQYRYDNGDWVHTDGTASDSLANLIAPGALTLGLLDGGWHTGLGNVTYKYDYANDEILFGAALYSTITGILKYNYTTQVWSDHDLRTGFDAWYAIPCPASDSAIQKRWFDPSLGLRRYATDRYATFDLGTAFPSAHYRIASSGSDYLYYYGGYMGIYLELGGQAYYGVVDPGTWFVEMMWPTTNNPAFMR